MQVRTRSQTKALYNTRLAQVKVAQVKVEAPVKVLKVEAPVQVKVEAQVPKVEAPLPKSKLALGIWFVASLKKYNNLAKETCNQAIKYKSSGDKYHAFREVRFEHLRILSEMYSVVVEYFDEVMEAEPEVFVHYEEILCAHITEATCKFKYYLPKTEEERLTFKTFKDIILEASAVINAPSKKY